ncbi:MAG: hypothetical protein QM723_02255 [Myxococcaceae bacterium]
MNAEASMHPGELLLRRLMAAETVGADVQQHVKECERCKAKVKSFEDEQRKFELAIPFDRFAAGVERAQRSASKPVQRERSMRWVMALAASLILVMAGGVTLKMVHTGPIGQPQGTNGIKGGEGIEVHIAAQSGVQRIGSPEPLLPETLQPGDRVRIGYHDMKEPFIAVVSIDEKGELTSYPLTGTSMKVLAPNALLPETFQFDGTGMERMIVFASKEPVEVEELKRAVKVRFDEAHGNLKQMGRLELPGEQFDRTFLKP